MWQTKIGDGVWIKEPRQRKVARYLEKEEEDRER